MKHDKDHVFRFSPLQGSTAGSLFEGVTEEELYRSFWLKDADGLHRRSTAFLRVFRHLKWPVSWLYAMILVPLPIRDWVYNLIAKNRYRIWGRSETCRIPTQEERAFFLP